MNMVVSAAALSAVCGAFVIYDVTAFRTDIVRNLSIQAQEIGSNSVSALLFNDPQSAENTLSAFRLAPNVASACIYDAEGRPFAPYRRDTAADFPATLPIANGENERHWFENGHVKLVHSITFQGKLAGGVYIESDLKVLATRLGRYVSITGAVFIGSLALVLFMSTIARRSIAGPVSNLAETARSVARNKNYSARAKTDGNLQELNILVEAFNEMLDQIETRDLSLERARDELERRVEQRTSELTLANKELESFSYSVSHDLRAPLRSIDGFSLALWEDYSDKLDSQAKDFLTRIRFATKRMGTLIDDLLNLSRMARMHMKNERVDLSALVRSIVGELQKSEPQRSVSFIVDEGLEVQGDPHLLRVVLDNLLANSWKYTSRHPNARIEFRRGRTNGCTTYFVRDDGAGFDAKYADKLFGAFQRLHGTDEFPGTGVGLATVQRIIHRHGGRIWAEGAVEKGATFYFTLQSKGQS